MAVTTAPVVTLSSLAQRYQLELYRGAGEIPITGVCALEPGKGGCIAFAENAAHADALARSQAGAVIVTSALADTARVPVLIAREPRLAFARIAGLFEVARPAPGVHARSQVDASAQVHATASIGAHVVIGHEAVIEEGVVIGANTVIGAGVHIGRDGTVASNCSIGASAQIGERVVIEANAVLGARGFGLVHNGRGWEPVPQMGRVRIGDDVEIGAGTTIDRGALDDTVIGCGVKIDNQVHIGHNCVIGDNTVIAGCTGIAGSCTIGANCMIGGGVGIGDHLRIVDGVIITAASQVPKSIERSGVYSTTFRAMPARVWRKRLALFRQLDRIEQRLRQVERGATKTGDK